MHGFIDSWPVPMHLPASNNAGLQQSAQSKGKQKATNAGSSQSTDVMYNIVDNWTSDELASVQRRVAMASRLGYSTILLTITISPTTNPASLEFPTPLFPSIDPRTAPPGTDGLILQLWRVHVADYTEEHIKSASIKGQYGFSNSTASLFPNSTTLLSVAPTSLNAFSHVALSLSPPSPYSPTLVTMDPSVAPRLPFPLKRGLVNQLQRAGLMFEIVYRGMTRQDAPGGNDSSTAPVRRRNWIAGAREIVRAMGGKGVVLSSGALHEGEMRASEDLVNLCSLIGLTPKQAKDALTVNPLQAISRGKSMRCTYRGVISNPSLVVTQVAESEVTPSVDMTTRDGAESASRAIADTKSTASPAASHNKKRKADDEVGGGRKSKPSKSAS